MSGSINKDNCFLIDIIGQGLKNATDNNALLDFKNEVNGEIKLIKNRILKKGKPFAKCG